jgi:hypothetical protein
MFIFIHTFHNEFMELLIEVATLLWLLMNKLIMEGMDKNKKTKE